MQKSKHKVKVLLTGGHARSTAYAVIQETQDRHKNWEIYWIGPKSVVEGKRVKSFDDTFAEYDIRFRTIHAGKLQRKFTVWTIPSILKIPLGFVHAFFHILSIRPDLVLSFGGFVAYPVVVVAWLFRIPVIIHEQTIAAGRANIYSAKFAKKVVLARAESKKYFPMDKSIVIGNPVSKEIVDLPLKQKLAGPPRILVTGGASGAVVVNKVIEQSLRKLLPKFRVIHQTGKLQYHHFKTVRARLPAKLRKNYHVHSVISKKYWHKYLGEADIVISRAGANIVSEIIVAKKPSILVPIPWSVHDEQRRNAEYAKAFGVAQIIEQEDLTVKKLYKEILKVKKSWKQIVVKVKDKSSPDIEASAKLVKILENSINA
jgi:UDP-N-acetylglucosamine--N-acetylmuramyl-(pentapeptide) pyrophosphoryl-undecaprenol N-acetylglucosamine transferase